MNAFLVACSLDGGSLKSKFACLTCYQDLMNLFFLRAFVPAVLLGEAEPKVNEQSAKMQEQQTVRSLNSKLLSNALVIF